jgi:hypothetical protein
MMKALMKLGIKGTYFNLIKATYDKPIANLILNEGEVKPLPLKSGMRQSVYLSTLIQLLNS